ncbi:hypothetical protein SPI_01005 [Niveomyces insectorum RCEF 264]|uniref:Uncharacterized protein n=1 Tax=Niveomyces insectorum RCEF 264 TaxID=1081102 RepID=A0A167YL15_9HYPO|nr:hypothetical protein SPI_01005 [Niveomyces insectorum RCEF 264]
MPSAMSLLADAPSAVVVMDPDTSRRREPRRLRQRPHRIPRPPPAPQAPSHAAPAFSSSSLSSSFPPSAQPPMLPPLPTTCPFSLSLTGALAARPMARPAKPTGSRPGTKQPLDANDLSRRLHVVFAQQQRQEAAAVAVAGSDECGVTGSANDPGGFQAPSRLPAYKKPSATSTNRSLRNLNAAATRSSANTASTKRATAAEKPRVRLSLLPYVPNQASKQFAQTTVTTASPHSLVRMQIRAELPVKTQPPHQRQNGSSSSQERQGGDATRPAKSRNTTTGGASRDQHRAANPWSTRRLPPPMSAKQNGEHDGREGKEVDQDGEASEFPVSGEKETKAVGAVEYCRLVKEHSVDWTQSDEAPLTAPHRHQTVLRVRESKSVWRFRARLSSFTSKRPSSAAVRQLSEAEADARATAIEDDSAASTSSSTPSPSLSFSSSVPAQAFSKSAGKPQQTNFLFLFKH